MSFVPMSFDVTASQSQLGHIVTSLVARYEELGSVGSFTHGG
jgi:hypothetical protein